MITISSKKKTKLTTLALAISYALVSCHSYAAADRISANDPEQPVYLTPGTHYLNDGLDGIGNRTLINASAGGSIIGIGGEEPENRITLESHRTDLNDATKLAAIGRVSGSLDAPSKIELKNVDIFHRNHSNVACSTSSCTAMLTVYGAGAQLDISNARIESFYRPIEIQRGGSAVIDNTEFILQNYGLLVDRGGTLSISNSQIRQSEPGAAIQILFSGKLNLSDSLIETRSLGVYLSTTNTAVNSVSTDATLHNVDINISREGNNAGKGIYLASFSRYAMPVSLDAYNTRITTQGNDRASLAGEDHYNSVGIFGRNTQVMSYFRGDSPENAYIHTQDNDSINVYMFAGSHITLENSGIYLDGNRSIGLYADHNNGLFSPHNPIDNSYTQQEDTTITARNIKMTISGNGSAGAVTQADNSKITIDGMQLTATGNNVTGLWAKTRGSELKANGVTASFSGDDSLGMRIDNGATAELNNSYINMTGNNSHGMSFDYVNNRNTMTLENTHIETADGYAIWNKNGGLDLTLDGSTLIGRTNGESGTAIYIDSTRLNRARSATLQANNNSYIIGDIKFAPTYSTGASSLDFTLDNSHFVGNVLSDATNFTFGLGLTNGSSITTALSNTSLLSIDETSRWNVTGDSTVSQFEHRGHVSFNAPESRSQTYSDTPLQFSTLTINHDYQGQNGLFTINTVLGGDDSLTDKIVINGNTSGTARLFVNNFGGYGAPTVNGIEVITINPRDENGNAISFSLADNHRIVTSLYEYFLHQDDENKNWYLRSQLAPITLPTPGVDPIPPVVDPDPDQEPEPTPEPNPGPDPDSTPEPTPVYRPEAGGYLANIAAANKLFNLRLEDREGRAENSSLWLRQVASRNQSRDSSDQLRIATNSFVTQLGGEVWQTTFANEGRLGFGIMAAYGKANSESRSKLSQYYTKSQIDGYSLGIYSTWYQNAQTLNGAYVDSWLQYSWLDAEVNGQHLATEKYDMDGFSASLETGYRFGLAPDCGDNVFLTPQAQIIWNGIKADNHRETNGTLVKGSGHNNIQTRLGVKFSFDGVSSEDEGKDKLFTLYAEANWLYNSKRAGAIMDNVKLEQTGSRNVGEVKLGFEGQLNKHVHVWTNVAQQLGTKGYKDTAATVGMKYTF